LNTLDLDVLKQVLYLMVRAAQRVTNPKAIRSSFVAPQDRIVELARGWTNVQVELLRIAKENLEVTPKMMTLNLQFYRTSTAQEGHQIITEVLSTEDLQKDDIDIFTKLVKQYDIPKEYQFELANRIRIAKYMNDTEKRKQLLGIRLLAMTVMCKYKNL
jgi:E3 ubiquitin-protein ligase HUWE1